MGRALVVINNRDAREKVISWATRAPWGTRVEFKGKARSLDQNDMMWARLTEVSKQVEWYGQKLTADDWKDIFSASLRHARVVPGLDPGTYVPLGMRTSDMSTEEMTQLIELIGAFAAQRGVVFPWEEAVAA